MDICLLGVVYQLKFWRQDGWLNLELEKWEMSLVAQREEEANTVEKFVFIVLIEI